MTWQQWATLAIALVGALLGVINTWQGWRDKSVRLKVIPKYAEPIDVNMQRMKMACLSIEVQNRGSFAVTIEEIGVLIGKSSGHLPRRAPFPPAQVIMGPSLPHRLERHDAISLVIPVNRLPEDDITGAYARTAAGHLVRGTSPALVSIAEVVRPG